MVAHLAALYERQGPVGDSAVPEAEKDVPELDEALTARMYLESESRHRRLLEVLAAEAGQWIFTAELAAMLGVTSGTRGMAGIFGAFGRRAKHRYGGRKPWTSEWDPVRSEARYRMDPQVAAWIVLAAREERE
jgi:hypothetical protein